MLLDVGNVALGHAAGMRWNPADKWLFSEQAAHSLITGKEQFEHAQAILGGRTDTRPTAAHAPMPSAESCSAGSATGA